MADPRTLTTDGTSTDAAGRHRAAGRRPAAAAAARAALVVVTATTVLLDAPTWLRTALTVVTAVLVTEWVVRHRRRGVLDAALVGTAGLVVAAVLLGLLLNLTPDGLTRGNWAIGAGVLALGALAAATHRPMPPSLFVAPTTAAADPAGAPGRRTSVVVGTVCTLAAVVVVAVSFVAAAASTRENQVDPLVLASTVGADGGLDLSLSSGTPTGPYDVVVVGDGVATTVATDLRPDTTPITLEVALPAGRALVNVLAAGSATPVRQLIFDDGQPVDTAATTTTTAPTAATAGAPLMGATTTDGLVTGVTLTSATVTGPYDLVVVTGGGRTVVAGGFYLDGTARAVAVEVPATGTSRIELVGTGSPTPVAQLTVLDGRLVP